MAIKEQDKVFYEEAENGDKVINLPVTRVNNVEGLGRSANTAYVDGDVAYVDNNKKVVLKCIQAGTTSANELSVASANIGDVITDGTVKWQVCNRTSDVTSVNGKTGDVVVDLPVGHMYWSVEPNVPAGRLPAMGATYNRTLYADLWAWANSVGLVKSESEWQAIASANDGYCEYYSSGNGSSTFRVPKLPTTIASDVPSEVPVVGNGMTLGLTNGSNNGALAGGYLGGINHLWNLAGYYGQNASTIDYGGDFVGGALGITTDPTKSGIVAQTSATKITGQWLIVAFGVAHNIGNADVADVMQAVEQVQTSVGTLEQGVGTAIDYIVESYRNGTEWYEVYKSGKVRQGGKISSTSVSDKVITFLLKMANTDYDIKLYTNYAGNDSGSHGLTATNNDISKMTVHIAAGCYVQWRIEGQGA